MVSPAKNTDYVRVRAVLWIFCIIYEVNGSIVGRMSLLILPFDDLSLSDIENG